jgi:hypothetical protein
LLRPGATDVPASGRCSPAGPVVRVRRADGGPSQLVRAAAGI